MKLQHDLIANAHLDPVWQWRMPEGLALVKSTFRSALDRMKEFPDYTFTSACAGYYKYILCSEPEMFEEIRQRVREGRWAVVGGMWVQPDCNLPSGEAFCRHLLYSQRFFQAAFGAPVKTGYNVDSFGHNGMLPQLLRKAGIENYVYQRPDNRLEKPNLPAESLHDWQSPDGSVVRAFRIPDSYGGDLKPERLERHYNDSSQPMMIFFGVGNHGGGPSKEHLQQAQALIAAGGYQYGTPDAYFARTRDLPVPLVAEDLQHHASGCYSANSAIKAINRSAETALVTAESLDLLAHLLTGSALHTADLAGAWERVMFNQFHDILAGCSIREAYDDAAQSFGLAQARALEINTFAAQRISWRIKTTAVLNGDAAEMRDRLWYKNGEGAPLVVFNPNPFPVHAAAQFGTQYVSAVLDAAGNAVPFQLVRAPYTDGTHCNQCLFEAKVPALGYAVYYLYRLADAAAPAPAPRAALTATETTLENDCVRIQFDRATGAVSEYLRKADGQNYADGLLGRALVCDDAANDTWGHGVFDYNKEIGAFGGGTLTLLESGPLRATVKSVVRYGDSVLTRYYSLFPGSEQLTVRTVLDMRERYCSVKLSFPVAAAEPRVTYSMPFGFIQKPTNGQEEPSHAWCDLSDAAGCGLALLNSGKYSFCAVGNDLRMMIARSCAYLDHYAQQHRDDEMELQDQGRQRFTYALVPHGAGATAALVQAAALLNAPLQTHQETHHDGPLPPVYAALQVDRQNLLVSAVKAAEDGDGCILRIVETAGEATAGTVTFAPLRATISAAWGPQEIKTFRIAADGQITECRITEEPFGN